MTKSVRTDQVLMCEQMFPFHSGIQGRAGRSVSTARPTLTPSVASALAACVGGSRTLTCSCCATSVTWRSTSTASTRRWPPSQMTKTGERERERERGERKRVAQ